MVIIARRTARRASEDTAHQERDEIFPALGAVVDLVGIVRSPQFKSDMLVGYALMPQVRSATALVRDSRGEVIGAFCINQDISQLVQWKKVLEEQTAMITLDSPEEQPVGQPLQVPGRAAQPDSRVGRRPCNSAHFAATNTATATPSGGASAADRWSTINLADRRFPSFQFAVHDHGWEKNKLATMTKSVDDTLI